MILSWNALKEFVPDIYFDTTGHAFTFVVARFLAGCHVAAYVHYPTISTDMLKLVWERRPTYNNNEAISGNPIKTFVKLCYYMAFSILYGMVGSISELTMVNSTWTFRHICKLWKFSSKITIVYPPCDTAAFESISLESKRERIILSIGQFRPEKDHKLQLQSFAKFKQLAEVTQKVFDVRLVLLGGCRNNDDWQLVNNLKELANELGLKDHVDFVINQPFDVLKHYLSISSVGLHTMWNEHFGIGIVECMAAGCITVAHKSGGPLLDIVVPSQIHDSGNNCGYLAATAEEYSQVLYEIFNTLSPERVSALRQRARVSSTRFSQQAFNESFKEAFCSSKLLN